MKINKDKMKKKDLNDKTKQETNKTLKIHVKKPLKCHILIVFMKHKQKKQGKK